MQITDFSDVYRNDLETIRHTGMRKLYVSMWIGYARVPFFLSSVHIYRYRCWALNRFSRINNSQLDERKREFFLTY